MADKFVFQPVRCLQEKLNELPIDNGKIYFAYDTGSIYLDMADERKSMGNSSSGIIYANAREEEIVKVNPDDENNNNYFIPKNALENQAATPVIDSLVLNRDGRFFRVIEVLKNSPNITGILLAVSGSGGGSIVQYSDRIKLNKVDPESSYLVNGKEAFIQVNAISGRDIDGSYLDEKLTIHWTLSEQANTGVISQYLQGDFQIDASTAEEPIWANFEYGSKARISTHNILTMWATGSASTDSRSFEYHFYTSDLQLLRHESFNNINIYPSENINITCTTIGDLEKIIYYYFETNGETILLNEGGTPVGAGNVEASFSVPASLATHGVHKVRIELYQYNNGVTLYSTAATPIEMEIAVVETNNLFPIIWLGDYNTEYYQYDSIKIPFRVYDPSSTSGATIQLFKDNVKIGTRIITDVENFSIWEIVNADLNAQNYYTISCGQDENEVRREISFLVSEDPNRRDMKIASGARYIFDASGRSNSEALASRIKSINNNIEANFEGFNWYNNGWIIDENGNSCLRISNGAKFTIPLGQTKFATSQSNEQSHTFEFQFKIRNVQDYSQIIHNITRYRANTEASHGKTYPGWTDNTPYNNGPSAYSAFTNRTYLEWSNGKVYDNYDAFLQWYLPEQASHYEELQDPEQQIFPVSYDELEFREVEKILNTNYAAMKYYDGQHGICIGAQDALFTNGTDTVNVAYVEDKIVNLTIVYSHGQGNDGGSNKLMSIYLNGMLTGVARSTLNGAWNINSNSIVFDSQYCDFDLYKIRVYETNLSLSAILINYMVDRKDPVGFDLSKLGAPNSTLNELQFSYNSMLAYNEEHPDGYIMPYIVFTTNSSQNNKLPYSKQVPIKDVQVEFVNTGLDRAYANGELNSLAERAGAKSIEDYYIHHCPSWKGEHVEMTVQGTSSEFYPRRNYKAKTKNYAPDDETKTKKVQMYMNRGPFAQMYVDNKESTHLDWFYMDNDTVGTTKFTLKIDYMESSGTYNMGFANLVKNAYTHHPYYDYIKEGAFQKAETDYVVIDLTTEVYDNSKTYWYKNHKGNMKNTSEDELNIIHNEVDPAAAFAMGPKSYGISKGISKVNDTDNNWYEAITVYSDITFDDIKISDLRTSVQGFPVLAFHQKTDEYGNNIGNPEFIGRYNMLLDKGSDEAYGFKMDGVYQKFVRKKNEPVKINKVAECWEGENNSRGFCSFRDASTNREENDNRFFDTDKLTSAGAPIVADYWEYRYHDKADSLDVFYDLENKINDEESIAIVQDECGIDIADPTPAISPDNSYKGNYTKGIKDAGDKMLELYENWERAVKWVWSTNRDLVPSAGVYTKVDVGTSVYQKNTYYVLNIEEGQSSYVLDPSDTYDSSKTYYIDSNGENPIKLCENNDACYAANKFYVVSGLGDYILDPDGVFNADIEYYKLQMDEEHSGAKQLTSEVTYNNITYHYDTKEYRNAKFVNELKDHFNLEYLITYFVMTEVFECYDSRGKNMMMASWGPQKQDGDYIWYPVFYDIDTQLGINNTGIPSFEYYIDATEDGCFSTNDSLLFNNLYRNFRGAIVQKYRQLRGTSSTYDSLVTPPLSNIDKIEKWYLADPVECKSLVMRGERPLIALNLDEYYKYITITNSKGGYTDRYGNISYDNGTYFYMLQGDRSLSRQQFLTNRLNYIDSWLGQGQYERGGGNIVKGRISANRPSYQSDKWIEGTGKNTQPTLITNSPYWVDSNETQKNHMFDAEYWVDMEPVRNSYVTMGTDVANFPSQKYINTEGPVHFIATDLENGVRTSGGYAEQLLYIYGINQMKSLGDMSKLYWTEFAFESSALKLTELLLGYDGLDEEGNHYFNNNVNLYSLKASNSIIDSGGMPLLKKINLSYITFNDNAGPPTFNLTSCEKLQDFRAIGSNIRNVSFADGVALKTLYLPNTINILSLTEATQLNNIVTNFRVRDDLNNIDIYEGLYIPGLTDASSPENAISNINIVNLIGDHLGYDSFKLLLNYYYARRSQNSSYITVTGVDWSPYKLLTKGAEYNSYDANSGLYWLDDGHYSFKQYKAADYTEQGWNLAIQNGELYRLNEPIENSPITNTFLFDHFKDENNFFNNSGLGDNSIPIISGVVFINNETPIGEHDIEVNYSNNYPNLKFFFAKVDKVPSAKFVVLNDDGTYDLLAKRSLAIGADFFNNPLDFISSIELDRYDTRTSYDFYGWSSEPLSPSAVEELDDQEWFTEDKGHLICTTNNPNSDALTSDQWYDNWENQTRELGKYDYVFYAVYGIHKFKIKFYNGDGSLLNTTYVPAGQYIYDNWPTILPTKDLENIPENFYYVEKFTGWAAAENGTKLELSRNSLGRSSRDRNFYPLFEKDSVYNNILSEDFLYCDNNGTMRFKEANSLKGKVTLPKSWKGITVKAFTGFFNGVTLVAQNPEITHIFWEEGTSVTEYGYQAFLNTAGEGYFRTNLIYAEIPNNNFIIGQGAFSYCGNLFTSLPYATNAENESFINNEFFGKIGIINTFGFADISGIWHKGGAFLRNYKLYLPGNSKLTEIGRLAFARSDIREIELGSADDAFMPPENLGENIFNGLNADTHIRIYHDMAVNTNNYESKIGQEYDYEYVEV